MGTQCDDVCGNVRRPAQRSVALGHGHDGDGGFRRNPLGVADQVPIQHDVTEHSHPTALHPVDQV
jgi:hypothetical protein